jgi:anti-sigma factor RsiW
MTKTESCDLTRAPHVAKVLLRYVLGDVSAAERSRIHSHLMQCPSCDALRRRYKAGWTGLAAQERRARR